MFTTCNVTLGVIPWCEQSIQEYGCLPGYGSGTWQLQKLLGKHQAGIVPSLSY